MPVYAEDFLVEHLGDYFLKRSLTAREMVDTNSWRARASARRIVISGSLQALTRQQRWRATSLQDRVDHSWSP